MSSKIKREKKKYAKKDRKLIELINSSGSDESDSEHELSYYINDRVKLMKEVLKIIKPKKILSMAPDCMKNLGGEEINSLLLEELLGISNKRLKYIFSGQTVEEDSSSTDPEEEPKPVDVISLDDVTDDDFVIDLDSDSEKKPKKQKRKIKVEGKGKKIKTEKPSTTGNISNEQNLMNVLELLELQARARAIRSQLALENNKKQQDKKQEESRTVSDADDAVIIESPRNEQIVITSSDSETETSNQNIQKIDIIVDSDSRCIDSEASPSTESSKVKKAKTKCKEDTTPDRNSDSINTVNEKSPQRNDHVENEETEKNNLADTIQLNVEQSEVDSVHL